MKKVILLALFIVVGASLCTISAKKKKVVVVEAPKAAPVALATSIDTLSYVAGMSVTEGLVPYLKQQFGIDSISMPYFVEAFKEAIAKRGDAATKARAAGYQIASQVGERMLPGLKAELKDTPDSVNEDLFFRGFADAIASNYSVMKSADAQQIFKSRMEADQTAKKEKLYGPNRKAGEDFLSANAKKDSVVVLSDGLQYKVLVKGNGPKPKPTDKVVVKYEGKLIDGTVFDSSYARKEQTNKFTCNEVIKGWTEALTMMPVGSKWQIFVPQQLAYGEREAGKIKPYSALIFTIELVSIDNK